MIQKNHAGGKSIVVVAGYIIIKKFVKCQMCGCALPLKKTFTVSGGGLFKSNQWSKTKHKVMLVANICFHVLYDAINMSMCV